MGQIFVANCAVINPLSIKTSKKNVEYGTLALVYKDYRTSFTVHCHIRENNLEKFKSLLSFLKSGDRVWVSGTISKSCPYQDDKGNLKESMGIYLTDLSYPTTKLKNAPADQNPVETSLNSGNEDQF